MTLNELALSLIQEQDESSDNTDLITVVEGWIQDAISELASAYEWRWLRSTATLSLTASDGLYAVPATTRDIRAMRFQDTNEPIEYIDGARLIGIAEDFENEGKPQFWTWYSSDTDAEPNYNVQFIPIPDGSYTVEYLNILHPEEIATGDAIPLHREHILAVKNRVRAYILNSDKDYDGSDRALQLFYAQVQAMIDKEKTPLDNNIRMQVRDISNQSQRRLARLDPNHFS